MGLPGRNGIPQSPGNAFEQDTMGLGVLSDHHLSIIRHFVVCIHLRYGAIAITSDVTASGGYSAQLLYCAMDAQCRTIAPQQSLQSGLSISISLALNTIQTLPTDHTPFQSSHYDIRASQPQESHMRLHYHSPGYQTLRKAT